MSTVLLTDEEITIAKDDCPPRPDPICIQRSGTNGDAKHCEIETICIPQTHNAHCFWALVSETIA